VVRVPAFTVLFVCTGNVCRSPLAERLGRAHLDVALGPEARGFRVCSAGVNAAVGSGMHPDSALVLQGLGGSPAGFTARQFVGGMAVEADLVLTMTRDHREAVLRAAPGALARAFTLREAAGLAEVVGAAAEKGHVPASERARQRVAAWAAARWRRSGSVGDDVPDPIGRPVDVHQQVGEMVADALIPLLGRLTGAGGAVAAGEGAGARVSRAS
jgi:protein-tyrosine-phosphatase